MSLLTRRVVAGHHQPLDVGPNSRESDVVLQLCVGDALL